MKLTFVSPFAPSPGGGTKVIYNYANGFSRLGCEVHIAHFYSRSHPGADAATSLEWFEFDRRVRHLWLRADRSSPLSFDLADAAILPNAEFIFCFKSGLPRSKGRQIQFTQGYTRGGIFPEKFERECFLARTPKICVSRWLVSLGIELGVPWHELLYIPNGIELEKFRPIRPIDERRPSVCMVYSWIPIKGSDVGLTALRIVKERHPSIKINLLSTTEPHHKIPPWMDVHVNQEHQRIPELMNDSSIFLCASHSEGFGLPSAEAMACGCALVTTDNGGSREFATHGETALVSAPGEAGTLAENVMRLLKDDALRQRIAENGSRNVLRLDWKTSIEKLYHFLRQYIAFGA